MFDHPGALLGQGSDRRTEGRQVGGAVDGLLGLRVVAGELVRALFPEDLFFSLRREADAFLVDLVVDVQGAIAIAQASRHSVVRVVG